MGTNFPLGILEFGEIKFSNSNTGLHKKSPFLCVLGLWEEGRERD